MLKVLDMLVIAIHLGVIVVMGILLIGGFYLAGKSLGMTTASWWTKTELAGRALLLSACAKGFFIFLQDFWSHGVQNPWELRLRISVVLSLMLFTLIALASTMLRAMYIPYIAIAAFYWGVIFFGW